MRGPILLCTDMDRTLLPNGESRESPRARMLFGRLCDDPDVTLAYVTGRDTARVAAAIHAYDLPMPDHIIADVGTTITTTGGQRLADWDARIGKDWEGMQGADLQELIGERVGLVLQDASRQGRYKQSYEVHPPGDLAQLARDVAECLDAAGCKVTVVPSHDEVAGVGLLDVLPASAGKAPAIAFLQDWLGSAAENLVFAGDSGNDLDVLAGPWDAVLVANASEEVRRQALSEAERLGHADRLYLARGGVLDMNGNYAAGILEGVLHFHPEWEDVLCDR